MKIFTLIVLIGLIGTCSIMAQVPQAFKYQTVLRDNDGNVISGQWVSFQISILKASINGAAVYVEIHDTITNESGLVGLEIGNGVVVDGLFDEIDWADNTYFLQIEIDENGEGNYLLIGASQLLSVPYSINSQNSSSLSLTSPNGTRYEVTVDDQGNLVVVSSICPPTVSDIDENVYNTVLIGDQCWMKEDLKTTRYNNGSPISNVLEASKWQNLSTEAFVWYENNISWKDKYGALYNWYATADTNGLCPTGWHIPTNDEWTALTDFIGGVAEPYGNKLKSCRQVNSPLGGSCSTSEHPRWDEFNAEYGTDNYGFSGLPGGSRNTIGNFYYIGSYAYWWSSTETSANTAWNRGLIWFDSNVEVYQNNKRSGFSVRCIRD